MGSESFILRTQAAARPVHQGAVDLPHGIRLTLRHNAPAAAPTPPLPRAVLLHGFPEAAFAWDAVQQRLGGLVHTIAPTLRGFADSSRPADAAAYRAKHLVGDLVALLEQWGAPLDLLVAHDWGGALAWNLAAQRPDLIKRLLIINAPHPAAFLRELLANPAQQAASAYMNFLCRPDAERLLSEDDFRRLWGLFTSMGAADAARPGGGWLDEPTREQYRQVWRQGLQGGLNYYRASPLRPPQSADDAIHRLAFPAEAVTVNMPTTVLWGEGDTALLPGLLQGLEPWVPRLELIRVPEATHWIVHEQPDLVARTIARLSSAAC